MKTGVLHLGQLSLALMLCLTITGCNKDDYYEKEFLDNPYQESPKTTDGSVDGGSQGGVDSGTGGTQGGVSSGGVNGGTTSGGTTGNSSTGGVDGGSTVGGTNGGTTGGTGYINETEVFNQSATQTKKLDILWVIDNSGSMSDEQDALGTNFDAFIRDFITKNVDFKMAITTTDAVGANKGAMVAGSDTKLTSEQAALNPNTFMNDFRNMVRVGTNGSGNEKGLEGSEGFMQRYANSFLRNDAYLAVVILSDEEDQSAQAPSFYTDYLKSFKSEAGLVKVYSIVDVGLTNTGSNGVTTGYQRYAEASNLTAGIVADIRDDFYQVLTAMGDSLINLLDSFALAHDPIGGSLQVFVNGVLSSDYTFDAASRSIKFNQNNLPPVGAEIRVTYQR